MGLTLPLPFSDGYPTSNFISVGIGGGARSLKPNGFQNSDTEACAYEVCPSGLHPSWPTFSTEDFSTENVKNWCLLTCLPGSSSAVILIPTMTICSGNGDSHSVLDSPTQLSTRHDSITGMPTGQSYKKTIPPLRHFISGDTVQSKTQGLGNRGDCSHGTMVLHRLPGCSPLSHTSDTFSLADQYLT